MEEELREDMKEELKDNLEEDMKENEAGQQSRTARF